MKLYLLEGVIIHRAGQFTQNEEFSGFVEKYYIEDRKCGFDGYEFSTRDVVIKTATSVESNTSSRLRLVLTAAEDESKDSPIKTMFKEMRLQLNGMKLKTAEAKVMMVSINKRLEVDEAMLSVAERANHKNLPSLVLGVKRNFMATLRSLHEAN